MTSPGALAPVLKDMRHEPAAPNQSDVQYLRAATETLLSQAGGRPLVLFVDDAHLLDGASSTLSHELVMHDAVTLLATVRSREPSPDPIVSLWKDGVLRRLEVEPLTTGATARLVEEVLHGPVDPAASTPSSRRPAGSFCT